MPPQATSSRNSSSDDRIPVKWRPSGSPPEPRSGQNPGLTSLEESPKERPVAGRRRSDVLPAGGTVTYVGGADFPVRSAHEPDGCHEKSSMADLYSSVIRRSGDRRRVAPT